jgi:hypothetical protein
MNDCQICGLPTITDFGYTFCTNCYPNKLVCVTCREDGHTHINECTHPYFEPVIPPMSVMNQDMTVATNVPTIKKQCKVCKFETS